MNKFYPYDDIVSSNHAELYELSLHTDNIVCFIDYRYITIDKTSRELCVLVKNPITNGFIFKSRGQHYATLPIEKNEFVSICKDLNVTFIPPFNTIDNLKKEIRHEKF